MQCSAGVQLKVHEPTVQLMKEHYAKTGKEVNEARLRMATLPEGAEVSSLHGIQPQASNAHISSHCLHCSMTYGFRFKFA